MSTIKHFSTFQWVSESVIGLVVTIINGYLLQKECKKRKSKQVNFTNKSLKIFSIISIICCTLHGCFLFLLPFNGFCHFASPMTVSSTTCQYIFMEYYQLSILYYCFSSAKIYSNKGYPNWLFIIMYISITIICFFGVISGWLRDNIFGECGINKKYEYYYKDYTNLNILFRHIFNVSAVLGT